MKPFIFLWCAQFLLLCFNIPTAMMDTPDHSPTGRTAAAALSPTKKASFVSLDRLLRIYYNGQLLRYDKDNAKAAALPRIIFFSKVNEYATELRPHFNIFYQAACAYGARVSHIVADFEDFDQLLGFNLSAYISQRRDSHLLLPITIYAEDNQHNWHVFKGRYEVEALKQFNQQLLDGGLYKSEPIPGDSDSLLKVCVANNFQQVVQNSDVLLMFYAPWCRFSQQLFPVLEELAQLLKYENVQVMKMNVDANYAAPLYDIYAYPTIVYIRKSDMRDFVLFKHTPRTMESLLKFVAASASEELQGYNREGNPRAAVNNEI